MSGSYEKTHWPLYDDGKAWRSRCKNPKCIHLSKWFCEKCQKHFCLTTRRNCFYHHESFDENHNTDRQTGNESGIHQATNSQHDKKTPKRTSIPVKKDLQRRSSAQSMKTPRIGQQPQKTMKEPKRTAMASKLVRRKPKSVDRSQEVKANKALIMSSLGLCSVQRK